MARNYDAGDYYDDRERRRAVLDRMADEPLSVERTPESAPAAPVAAPPPSATPTAPSAPPPSPTSGAVSAPPTQSYGVPAYNQIAQYMKAWTGREPTFQEVSQWGTNIDAAYLQKIYGAIRQNMPRAAQTATAATPPPETAPTPPSVGATPAAAPPPGWDPGKWADPTHTSPKYVVGRILAGYPPTPEGLASALPAIQAAFPGTTFDGHDAVTIPGVGTIDVGQGFRAGQGAWQWLPVGQGGGGQGAAVGRSGVVATPGMAGGLGGVSYDPRTGYQFGYAGGELPPELSRFYSAQTQLLQSRQQQDQAIRSAMRDALLRLMQQGQEPVDVQNDQTLGPQASAYRNAQRREQTRGREALAERYAQEGLNLGGQGSGSYDAALQSQEEDVRNAIAGYEAQLAGNELQNRRQLLTQALSIAQAFGAQTEANQLQRELADLDAQLRQQGLAYQYSSLGQQQGQFEDTMGLNYANLQYQMNRDALLAGLNG